MDEALRRLGDVGQAEDGLLVCYDADCRCSPNYFTGIELHFASEPDAPGCSIHFEHPLDAGEWAARSEDTRLNSSHVVISYAVFCLKKKKPNNEFHC